MSLLKTLTLSLFQLALLVCLATLQLEAALAQSCSSAFSNVSSRGNAGRSNRSPFWNLDRPVEVHFREAGVTRELSYSIDSEIPLGRTLAFIQMAPKVVEKLGPT